MKSKIMNIKLDDIQEVTFFKRDELTTDLVCCNIVVATEEGVQTLFCHEDAEEWQRLMSQIESLPNFNKNWRESVIFPAFEENRNVAFSRSI